MEMQQKIQVLEGVLTAVINRALNGDKLPPAVVRLALTEAAHTVRELERQQAERLEAEKRRENEEAAKKAAAMQPADGPVREKEEAKDCG